MMSVIQNFKKRQLAKAAEAKGELEQKLDQAKNQPNAKPTTALALLAALLNVAESEAIVTAQQYVESNINFFNIGVDLAAGDEKTVTANVETNSKGDVVSITNVEEFEAVKDELSSSADKASDAASDLAYSASDIEAATDGLKEATEELKKPSAVPKSSNLKKTTKQKDSSNK